VKSRYHVPVLEEQVVGSLLTDPDGTYVDGTLGGGGHARLLAGRLGPRGRLLGIDRDPEALAVSRTHLAAFSDRIRLLSGDFGHLLEILERERITAVQGILLDLGVSSQQLDEARRGFSFLREGPLDMRMDPATDVTAATLVNELPEAELTRLFREYGEQPRAPRVARAIVHARARRPIQTTAELAQVVEKVLGRRGSKHPATRVFQALRIAVNRELDSLDAFLRGLPGVLHSGGRVVVISYHSLEDRRVKQALRRWEPQCRCPPRAPRCTCGRPGLMRALNRKAVRPSQEEVAANPRARSARLRAAERLSDPQGQGGRT
jgi:16S rRNA (cytosine1402-N4)-methyltransferase